LGQAATGLLIDWVVEIDFVVARQIFYEWIFQFDDSALLQLGALKCVQVALTPQFY